MPPHAGEFGAALLIDLSRAGREPFGPTAVLVVPLQAGRFRL
jgi:hypothetical protein